MTEEIPSRWPEILKKIRTRGHWELIARPAVFPDQLLDRRMLLNLVEGCQVRLRGWYFPHVDHHELGVVTKDWVGQAHQFEHSLEHWRMYTSGQFVSVCGIPHEWRDESGFWPAGNSWKANAVLGAAEATFRMIEFVSFASRLSQSDAGGDPMYLRVALGRAEGRRLVVDSPNRAPLMGRYVATADRIDLEREVHRDELVVNTREIAASLTEELFGYFGWQPASGILQGLQDASRLVRVDQSEDAIEYCDESFEFSLDREDMKHFDLQAIQRKLTDLSTRIGEAQTKRMLEVAGAAADSVGNVVHTGGTLTPDHLLDVFRKVEMDFDPETEMATPGFVWVMHPDTASTVLPKAKEWEKDPAFQREHERILTTKREEWRVREARRKLVD